MGKVKRLIDINDFFLDSNRKKGYIEKCFFDFSDLFNYDNLVKEYLQEHLNFN